MTNAPFGLVLVVTWRQRSLWPWADQVGFWGLNAGLLGFVVGLLLESAALKRAFSPVMGLSILLAMLVLSLRLRAGRLAPSPR